MFNSTKYTKFYLAIIAKAKGQRRRKCDNVYYEMHHIIPKSLGGSNEPTNLVLLTAKEHFVVHHLLTKMTCAEASKIKMLHAFWRMCHAKQHKQHITAKVYAKVRSERSVIMSTIMSGHNNHFYGKTHSNETKEKMRKAATGRNPHDYFDGHTYPSWNKDLTKENNETLKRISEARMGSGNPMYGKSGKNHPNTKSYALMNENGKLISIFHSRKEFNEYCRFNSYPFNGLYKTVLNDSYYMDLSKNRKYESFNNWSLRVFEG